MGFVSVYPDWVAVRARVGSAVVSKMAALAKTRAKSKTKLRLIIDMLRSNVNAHATGRSRVGKKKKIR